MTGFVKEIDSESFERTVSQGITLVDFWAPWCSPCKMQVQVLEEVAKNVDGRVNIVKLNIDRDPKIASQFGIQAIPTLILFKNGKEKQRFIGLQSDTTLIDGILELE